MISYKDLSWPLKASVIMSWAIGVLYGVIIVVSFIGALLAQ